MGPSKAVREANVDIGKHFKLTELGTCSKFLGISISKSHDVLLLSEKAYIGRILEKTKMTEANPAYCTSALGQLLYEDRQPISDKAKEQMHNAPYREILGLLLYFSTITRPEIATALYMLGNFQSYLVSKH